MDQHINKWRILINCSFSIWWMTEPELCCLNWPTIISGEVTYIMMQFTESCAMMVISIEAELGRIVRQISKKFMVSN